MANNSLPPINYTQADYNSLIAGLQSNLQAQFGSQWTDFYQSNIGSALVQSFAYVADILNFYTNLGVNESYIGTAQDLSSMLNLTQLVGYSMSASTAASVLCTASPNPVNVNPLIIAEGTSFTSDSGVNFEILSNYTIPGSASSIELVATAGTTTNASFTSNGGAFQTFVLPQANEIEGSVVVTVNGQQWTQTNSLADGSLSGGVASIAVQSGGSGYTTAPTVVITNVMGSQGSGATATAVISGGSVTAVNVNTAGQNYSIPPIITFTGGGGTGASATSTLTALTNANSIYTITHDNNYYAYINFGDGNLGAIPPNNATIAVTYRINGGVSGNIPIGSINTTIQAQVSGSSPAVYVNVNTKVNRYNFTGLYVRINTNKTNCTFTIVVEISLNGVN